MHVVGRGWSCVIINNFCLRSSSMALEEIPLSLLLCGTNLPNTISQYLIIGNCSSFRLGPKKKNELVDYSTSIIIAEWKSNYGDSYAEN